MLALVVIFDDELRVLGSFSPRRMHLESFADLSTLSCGLVLADKEAIKNQATSKQQAVRWRRRLLMTRWWVASRKLSDPWFLGRALSHKLGLWGFIGA